MKIRLTTLAVFLLLSGCATLSFQKFEVRFEDPLIRLGVEHSEPTEEEARGVLLRLLPPEKGFLEAREETLLYQLIKEGQGVKIELHSTQRQEFKPGSQPNSFELFSETKFEEEKGYIVEEFEMTSQGEILKFIRGFHNSKMGKFQIVNWSRTPIFPSHPVQVGEKWNYDEVMDARLDSFWIKERNPEPYIVKATSTLTGFATVKGMRCAVIETRAFQRKKETVKIFFKEVTVEMTANIQETTYLDYAKGQIAAKVTKTESFSVDPKTGFENKGESQTLTWQG